MKKVLGALRRADERFSLIADGDRIAVGLSGGKDSMLMLRALRLYQLFSKKDYSLHAICVDLGFGNYDLEKIKAWTDEQKVPLSIVPTDIAQVVFDIRQEKNPCSLCAKMRKGALYEKANQLGCNKAAFGHHMDDCIETFMMNLLFAARVGTFAPKAYLTRQDITLIRPFIFLREWDIKGAVNKAGIPVAKNPCPQDEHTSRQDLKDFLKHVDSIYPHASERIATAIANTETYDLWKE
ncbi:MAG: tRNA 2-thiocytidine biosynthesis protein TtcA [Clostridia bacterium]|nr:tRNA 2-thiocytidine biosynthesis protein TtcA [Clostridia bacterium]